MSRFMNSDSIYLPTDPRDPVRGFWIGSPADVAAVVGDRVAFGGGVLLLVETSGRREDRVAFTRQSNQASSL